MHAWKVINQLVENRRRNRTGKSRPSSATNVATTIAEVNYVKHYNRNGGSKAVVETVAVGADRFSTKMEARQYG